MFHNLEAFLQTRPFVSECAVSVRMAGTAGGEWKIFKLEAEEELRVEVNFNKISCHWQKASFDSSQ